MSVFDTTIRIGCAAGIGMMTTQLQAGVTEPAPVLEEETAELPPNWVDVSVGAAFTGGDKAAYQRRLGQDGDFYGGISDMHLESMVDDLTWTLDGHAMFGNEDYELILGLQKDGLGYVEAGYREFRSWYDGSGGYLQGSTSEWAPAFDDELYLDRGELWFEAGLRMEDLPEITFRYTHGWREGQKDSTSWGSNDVGKKLVPAYFDIDEQRDTFELDVTHTLGNTDLALGLVYERIEYDNTRVEYEEVDPGVTAQDDTANEVYDADLFNAYTSSVTRLNDQMMLSFGYAFTTMDTDTDGSTNSGSHQGQAIGGGDYKSHTLNTNFWWNPIEDFVLVPSVRAQWEDFGGSNRFVDGPDNVGLKADNDYQLFSEQLEARYTGIDNLGLYAKILMTQESGDMDHFETESGDFEASRFMDSDKDSWKAAIGGTYYARRNLSIAAEYYHKNEQSDYDAVYAGGSSSVHLNDYQINELDKTVDDINLRLTWRALPNLTLVTRYDWQSVTYDAVGVTGSPPSFALRPEIESGESERNVLSQSVTYLPMENLYLTGFVSYTWADTETASSRGVPGTLSRSDNDFLTANLSVGYAIDNKTDVTAGYSYYYADNYSLPDGSNVMAYGTDLEEHVFSVRLNRWIKPNMVWNVGYGYYNSNDGTSGGYNDFNAHMVSTGLQVRF